jgi:RNA polymerase sigma-70 factor, ECF subfamily
MLSGLVERAKQGAREAFTTLAAIEGDRLYGVAYRILRDPHQAEDAVQQTLLTAWRETAADRDSHSPEDC